MPITGSIDVADIIANLGDGTHGLRPAGMSINREEEDADYIYRATYSGPIDFSTTTTLATTQATVWDVNGYYQALGLEWPYRPSKTELRLGYQESGGPNSERLTYYFKQLLNPFIRDEYDRMPLGKKFRDKYVIEQEVRELAEYAAEVSESSGKMTTVEDLLKEYESHKPPSLPELENYEDDVIRWVWGYFLWNSRKYETEQLARWQSYLVSAMSARGIRRKLSIGYVGKTKQPFIVRQHEGRVVFFLNEKTEPTIELAHQAVRPKTSNSRKRKKKQ